MTLQASGVSVGVHQAHPRRLDRRLRLRPLGETRARQLHPVFAGAEHVEGQALGRPTGSPGSPAVSRTTSGSPGRAEGRRQIGGPEEVGGGHPLGEVPGDGIGERQIAKTQQPSA